MNRIEKEARRALARQKQIYDVNGKPVPSTGVFHAQIILQVCGQRDHRVSKQCTPNSSCDAVLEPSQTTFLMLEAVADSLITIVPCVAPDDRGFIMLECDMTGGKMASTAELTPFESEALKIDTRRNELNVLERINRRWFNKNPLGWHPSKNNCQDFVWYVLRQLLQKDAENVELNARGVSVKSAYRDTLLQRPCVIMRQGRIWQTLADYGSHALTAASRFFLTQNPTKALMQAKNALYLRDWKELKSRLPTNGRITRLWVKWNVADPSTRIFTVPAAVVQDSERRAQNLDDIRR